MPGWYYSCMHLTWLGMLLLLIRHIAWLGEGCSPSWCKIPNALPNIQLVFFASGWFDLIGSPPKSWKDGLRRWGIVVLVYLAWQVLVQAFKVSNIWPVLLMITFKTICWPLRLLAITCGARVWAAGAATTTTAIAAFVANAICQDGNQYGNVPQCFNFPEFNKGGWGALQPAFTHDWFEKQIKLDFQSMLSDNFFFTCFACYALYPPLVAHIWPGMWTPPPVDPSAWAATKHKAWRLAKEPAIQRVILSAVFLVIYVVVIINNNTSSFFGTVWAVPFEFMMSLGLFAALMHLLPSKPTVLSALVCLHVRPLHHIHELDRTAFLLGQDLVGRSCPQLADRQAGSELDG